jgi:hypothetical protein
MKTSFISSYIFSGKAWFYFNGYTPTIRCWRTSKTHFIHRVPCHDVKVGVWYPLSEKRMMYPVFYADIVNSEGCVRPILQLSQ